MWMCCGISIVLVLTPIHNALPDTMPVQVGKSKTDDGSFKPENASRARYSVARDSHEDVIGIHGKDVYNDNSD